MVTRLSPFVQLAGEEIRTLSVPGFVGGGSNNTRFNLPVITVEPSVTLFVEQWTPQAADLYHLLILTFSTDSESFADLPALQRNAGLSDNEWEDLMQFTTQVSNALWFSTII